MHEPDPHCEVPIPDAPEYGQFRSITVDLAWGQDGSHVADGGVTRLNVAS